MATELYYSNQQILSGQPTPLIGIQESMILYGERFAVVENITLRGQITGNCFDSFDGLIDEQKRLIDVFSKDFQTFEVIEDGNIIHSKPFCVIKNGVRFPPSRYNRLIEYEVDLTCWPSGQFSGFYGVLDPTDEWVFTEKENRTLAVTHSVAARGFNTSSGESNAYQNARNFVASRTGNDYSAQPYFTSLPSGFGICLRTVKEETNRFNGTYSLTLNYEGDLYYNQGGILRYTTDVSCNTLEGLTNVSVQGNIVGCRDASIQDVRNRYTGFHPYDVALESYEEVAGNTNLNTYYTRSGVTEEPFKPALSFNILFDNFTGASVIFDYRTQVNSGENDVITVAVDGTIKGRGDIKTRWENVSGYYSTLDLFSIAEDSYNDFGGLHTLNSYPISTGVTYNKFAAEISANATWDDKTIPLNGFSSFEYSLDFGPSLQKVVSKPLLTDTNGAVCSDDYYTSDLGYKNRCLFAIQGNGTASCSGSISTAINNLKSWANTQFSTYCPTTRAIIEKNIISTGGVNNINFAFSWSAESANNVIQSPIDYESIYQLSLI